MSGAVLATVSIAGAASLGIDKSSRRSCVRFCQRLACTWLIVHSRRVQTLPSGWEALVMKISLGSRTTAAERARMTNFLESRCRFRSW